MESVELVPVDTLHPADSPRLSGQDEDHVLLLAQCTTPLPPILVQRGSRRVVDGMHRWRAAQLRGDTEIEVVYLDGSDDEAFVRAVEANTRHGLPLSLGDRKAAAARILTTRPEWSDRAIAAMAGLSPKTVATVRRRATEEIPQLPARVGRDGKVRPLRPRGGNHAGSRAAPLGEVRAPRRPAVREGRDLMQALANDPSLRFSETGRVLLRRLSLPAVEPEEWQTLLAAVPSHCAEAVTELAQAHAHSWQQFAQQVRRTAQPPRSA
ncbi:ParB N-terminal domain-containing protein [Kitasatospora sp. NBC_01287]|uniref:ParB/RepB/Spo0J family partition protein n=1 Tax=Kitasatospora sp. NBC_01287 TaxID=2903573 RepID=UPI002258F370|nr:ParB N-terminal domain-containing protein [Kitasatospora sp. NBC_01287]MCX4745120.1 ParB N-terminal domain-containing protein [Kitasatospora sp. NBC_01287]